MPEANWLTRGEEQNPMSRWIIRVARESDIDQLMKLRLALQEHMERQNPRIWRLSVDGREQLRDQLARLLSDEDVRIFVAVDSSEMIIGMVVGRIATSDRYVPAIAGSIELLFVSGPWRRCGIGSDLVRRLCQLFASRSVEHISVRYVVGNDEATRFWTKLGFQPIIVTGAMKLRDLERKIAGVERENTDATDN
jgi:ribosomal protein S18 acetylase RimI-like enzyme